VLIVTVAGAVAVAAAGFYLKHSGTAGYEHDLIATASGHSSQLIHQAIFETGPDLLQPTGFESLFGFDIGHIDTSYAHLGHLNIPVAVPFSLIVIGCGLALFRHRPIWGLFVLFTIIMMLVRVVHVRYFLQVLPLLIYAFWLFAVNVYRRLPPKWGQPLFVGMVVLLVVVNAGRSLAFIREQRALPFLSYYRDGACMPMVGMAEQLKRCTPEHAWVLAPEKTDRILTNLTGRYVAAPNATIDFNPQWQELYVLEPMDEDGLRWMREKHIGAGEVVGEAVQGRRKDRVWQLHRAVLLPQ